MTKKILFVVHRYPPFQGGSENMVRDMAEELYARGHDVWVLAGEHKGDRNDIRLTSDFKVLGEDRWDLVIVFGGDVFYQNVALSNALLIQAPVLQLLVLPSESRACLNALNDVDFLGCDTVDDWNHVFKYSVQKKARKVRLSITEKGSTGHPGFKHHYNIKTKNMFVSCGGFWPNKAMVELAALFNELKLPDTTLVLTGYDNRHNLMPQETEFVKPFLIEKREHVMSAIEEANLYILHSFSEGFGLVLLEAMLNTAPWAARNIAGAKTMTGMGYTYNTDDELKQYLLNFAENKPTSETLEFRRNFVLETRLIRDTANDIEKILKEIDGLKKT